MRAIVHFEEVHTAEDIIEITFAKNDWYQMKQVLTPVILSGLKEFRAKNRHSYPVGIASVAAWNAILDKMIRSFEQLMLDNNRYAEGDVEEGLALFGKYFQYLWD